MHSNKLYVSLVESWLNSVDNQLSYMRWNHFFYVFIDQCPVFVPIATLGITCSVFFDTYMHDVIQSILQ